jgi:hypothetical protein
MKHTMHEQQKTLNSIFKTANFIVLTLFSFVGFGNKITAEEISFSKQILPLLSNNCFECHGPDKEER